MNVTVWKYSWESSGNFCEFNMPLGAEILHIDVQRNTPCIWAFVNPDADKVLRKFLLVGTGHLIQHEFLGHLFHHGSFLVDNGTYVFHIFEITG